MRDQEHIRPGEVAMPDRDLAEDIELFANKLQDCAERALFLANAPDGLPRDLAKRFDDFRARRDVDRYPNGWGHPQNPWRYV